MNNANVDYDGSEEAPTCPLCMEDLDETDKDFFPCPCDYQVDDSGTETHHWSLLGQNVSSLGQNVSSLGQNIISISS